MAQMDDGPHKGMLIIATPKPGDQPGQLSSPDADNDAPDADDTPDADSSGDSCSNCYAYQPSTGRCLRFPPTGMEWSQVDPTDYCCEHKKGPQHDEGAQNTPQGQPPKGGVGDQGIMS